MEKASRERQRERERENTHISKVSPFYFSHIDKLLFLSKGVLINKPEKKTMSIYSFIHTEINFQLFEIQTDKMDSSVEWGEGNMFCGVFLRAAQLNKHKVSCLAHLQ